MRIFGRLPKQVLDDFNDKIGGEGAQAPHEVCEWF